MIRRNIMEKLETDWSRIFILGLAGVIYLITFLISPTEAKNSVIYALKEVRKLLIPLLVAIFVGGTVRNLITPDLISKIFDGHKGVFAAGTVGSTLPPCPFISYPVIKGFDDGGLKLPKKMTILVTTTVVETSQLFCGLAVFGSKIVGLRLGFAFIAAMIVSTIFYLYSTFSGKI